MSQRTFLQRLAYKIAQPAARLAFVTLFGGRSSGRQNFPKTRGAIVCANHQSHFDPVLVGLSCDRRLNYLARDTLFNNPLFGWLIRFLDAIPIRRDGVGIGGLKESLKRLKRGELLLVFPEGTRTRDGELSKLKPGFCALARRAKVSIVPVALDGAFQAWPRSQFLPQLAAIHVCTGEPISPEAIAAYTDEELVAEVSRRIGQCHQEARASRTRTSQIS